MVKVKITDFKKEMEKQIKEKEKIINFWNKFCEDVYQRVKKENTNTDTLSELEFKIFGVKAIGGIVNVELIAHPDFPNLASKIYPDMNLFNLMEEF